MAFNFFGFKKRPDIQDVEPKEVVNVSQLVPEVVVEPVQAPVTDVEPDSKPLATFEDTEVKSQSANEKSEAESKTNSTQDESALSENSPAIETDQFIATREDVIAAFKIFLGRMPESEEVIATWVGVKPQAILVDFLKSPEFLNHVQKSQFILALAKKVLDDRKHNAVSKEETVKEL